MVKLSKNRGVIIFISAALLIFGVSLVLILIKNSNTENQNTTATELIELKGPTVESMRNAEKQINE